MNDVFAARLAATLERTRAELARTKRLRTHPDALTPLVLPPSFAALLARVVAFEAAEGSGRDLALQTLYLETLPSLRAEQALAAHEPIATLFHRAVDWSRVPVLLGALDRLFAWLAHAGLDATAALGAPDTATLLAATPTLDSLCARTHYGGFLPLLYAYPSDLRRAALLLADGHTPEAVIDLLFAAPLVHELCHFQRARTIELPLYLDECIAAYLGVTLLPAMAFPDETGAHGLYAAPLLFQVGQWLARLVGGDVLLALQTGAIAAHDALGAARVDALLAYGWDDYAARRPAHLLSDNFAPWPWCRVLAGIAPDAAWSTLPPQPITDEDFAIVRAGLATMCLAEENIDGAFVVRRAPSTTPITIDLDACVLHGGERLFGRRAEYLFPPAIAAVMRARGAATVVLPSLAPSAIDDEVERIRRVVLP